MVKERYIQAGAVELDMVAPGMSCRDIQACARYEWPGAIWRVGHGRECTASGIGEKSRAGKVFRVRPVW